MRPDVIVYMKTKMEVEVTRYQQMTPDGLSALISTSERMLAEMQSMLAAMRKAQKRQKREARNVTASSSDSVVRR